MDHADTRYRELDGLRALSVAAVFAFHVVPAAPSLFGRGWNPSWQVGGLTIDPPLRVYEYVFHLNVGVQVFFVLSGFLITSMFVRPWLADAATPDLANYALRRTARIFPAYWIVLFVGSVTWFGLGEIDFPQPFGAWKHATLTYYFFRERYSPSFGGIDYGGLSVSWSLVAEITFYAFVPTWFAVVRRRAGTDRARVATWAAAGCIPVGALCVLVFAYRTPWQVRTIFGGVITVFGAGLVSLGIGMVLAVLVADPSRRERLRSIGEPVVRWWCAAGFTYFVLAWPEFPYLQASSGQQVWQRLVQPVIAALLVAPMVFAPGAPTRLHRVLRSKPLVWIGTISYGIYLWHTLIINRVLERWPMVIRSDDGAIVDVRAAVPALVVVGVAALVTLAAAAASWYLIERPILQCVGRLGRTRRRRQGSTLAPS
jgi:peptidoglycan/LPS O-acetylase OafA/YrhL